MEDLEQTEDLRNRMIEMPGKKKLNELKDVKATFGDQLATRLAEIEHHANFW